jgi:RasGEF domain/RasGEF N-terminal motif
VKESKEPSGARELVVDFLPSRGLKPAPNPDTGLPLDDSLPQHPDSSKSSGLPRVTSILRPATVDPTDNQAHDTFLIMEEESQDETMNEGDQPSSPDIGRSKPCDLARDDTGKSFDELIDRLLAPPMSKQDGKFVPVFLCLYRRFSSPSQVFSAVTNRFAQIGRSNDAQLTKVSEQLRYLQVLALWSGDYPGDFTHHGIRKDVVAFVHKLEKSRVFAYAAKEISSHLELATEDEDAEWRRFDGLDALEEAEESFHSQSEARSPSVRTGKSSSEELLKSSKHSSSEGSYEDSTPRSGAPSVGSSVIRSSNVSSKSQSLLPARNAIRQEADRLASVPRTRLSKIQWHQFVEIPDEEIAKELTRMDWIFYSSIRPRDLVRHVILTHDADKAAKSLTNVHRMVDHFNHLFCFVSGMILLRDKPKHRAQMLEKWMRVAWKVRQLNNYNTLGSIIAGINGTAVHRLTLTWELVPEQIRKEYMRLTILMGTVRSHSAYRMAWENSFFERIPFLPVYRKDLFAAETGNRTFVGSRGERINWRKFEIMGEVIISMQRSQDKPYKLPKSEQIMKLVLETKISQSNEVGAMQNALGGHPT